MPSKKKAEETKLETVPAPKVDVENQGLIDFDLKATKTGCGTKFSIQITTFPDSSVEYRSKRFNSVEPLRKNGCTDIPCLILFIVCMVMWAYVGFFGILDGKFQSESR